MRTFDLTLFPPPRALPGGDPNRSDGVVWPTAGVPWGGDLAALVRLLTTPTPARGKYACPFFVGGRLREGLRRDDHFEQGSVVGLDIDNGVTTREAHARFLDCFHIIYTSWSHTREAHRFRLVVPLGRDITPREHPLVWQVLARRIPGSVDPKTRNVSRAFFLPAIRPDGAQAAAKAWEAPVLNPDGLLIEALALVRPTPPTPPSALVRLPPELAALAARRRLAFDPAARRRAAEHLGAVLRETRAERVRCPRCGRPSVWFWLDPERMRGARCDHRSSCGWAGRLDELLNQAGDADV